MTDSSLIAKIISIASDASILSNPQEHTDALEVIKILMIHWQPDKTYRTREIVKPKQEDLVEG